MAVSKVVYNRVGTNTYEVVLVLDSMRNDYGMTYYIHNVETGKREWVAASALKDELPKYAVVNNPDHLDLDLSDFLVETKSGLRMVGDNANA